MSHVFFLCCRCLTSVSVTDKCRSRQRRHRRQQRLRRQPWQETSRDQQLSVGLLPLWVSWTDVGDRDSHWMQTCNYSLVQLLLGRAWSGLVVGAGWISYWGDCNWGLEGHIIGGRGQCFIWGQGRFFVGKGGLGGLVA